MSQAGSPLVTRHAIAIVSAALLCVACESRDRSDAPSGSGNVAVRVADTSDFFEWWDAMAGTDVGPNPPPSSIRSAPAGVLRAHTRFDSLPIHRGSVPRPQESRSQSSRAVRVGRADPAIVWWIPTDSGRAPDTPDDCRARRSYLGVAPFREWSELEVNPYCGDTYRPADVHIDLYWLLGARRPLLEITWKGKECTESRLYRYEEEHGRFELERTACG